MKKFTDGGMVTLIWVALIKVAESSELANSTCGDAVNPVPVRVRLIVVPVCADEGFRLVSVSGFTIANGSELEVRPRLSVAESTLTS